jgi:hypothetical protein
VSRAFDYFAGLSWIALGVLYAGSSLMGYEVHYSGVDKALLFVIAGRLTLHISDTEKS